MKGRKLKIDNGELIMVPKAFGMKMEIWPESEQEETNPSNF